MKKTMIALVSVVAIFSTIIAQTSAQAELISKASPKFENSAAYWDFVNYRAAKYLNVPLYFTVPYSRFTPISDDLYYSRSAESTSAPILLNFSSTDKEIHEKFNDSKLGLRLITVNNNESRKTNSYELANSGMFQPGDIVLSFRKEWYGTLRYSHVQLGISHAGLLYFVKGTDGRTYLKNLDMPMDSKHVGTTAYLDSDHYQGAPLLHVVRPRDLTPAQKSNINKWLQKLAVNGPQAYAQKKIIFNGDYSKPNYEEGKPMKFVGDLARIALGYPNSGTLANYCSEFAWSVLSLRDCDPDNVDVIAELKADKTPTCIREFFSPMPVLGTWTTDPIETEKSTIGLIDGVPLTVKAMSSRFMTHAGKRDRADRYVRTSVFEAANGAPERISQGHLSVEQGLLAAYPNFYKELMPYYQMINDPGADQNPEVLKNRARLNYLQMRNYSPTAFMVHAMLPVESKIKKLDYVGTIFYAGQAPMLDKEGEVVLDDKGNPVMVNVYPALRKIRVLE